MHVRVPAKVNLHLGVGPLRADGFHDLVTVFHAVALFDDVVATPADTLSLTVSGRTDGVPTDERNLAWRAAALLAERTGVEPGVALHLAKAIPVAGGMAGGSADAAGALLACARLWGVDADLPALAAELGSDVAFPLLGGTAVGTGRGEVLETVPCAATLHWVFAFGTEGISAGDAYREFDRHPPHPVPTRPAALLDALADGSAHDVAAHLHNDLQAAALRLRPALEGTLHDGRDALAGLVSGSGPTCAFLCADADHAGELVRVLTGAGHEAIATTGAARGAEVIG